MKNVALIIRRELASYLRTPSGYFIAAAYLICNGVIFNAWAIGERASYSTDVLQRYLMVSGISTMIAGVLFTMRLLAEERANGTQTLLFTSPIREGEIVLGKYLASLTFIVIIVALSLYLPALIFVNGKVSFGHIGAGYLGLLLIGASTLSLGMLASAMVPNPFFAVMLNLAFVVLLNALWWVARTTDGTWSAILSYAAPYYNHFQPFLRGIVQLSDLVFFGTLIYFSLLASTRVLKSQRWQ